MIRINFFKIKREHKIYLDDFLKILPEFMTRNILRYYCVEDQMRSVIGKLILRKMMITEGYQNEILNDYKLDKFNRPYFNKKIDFNISHSGGYVVCAISDCTRLGVDIEKVYPTIEIDDYKFLFNDYELSIIKNDIKKTIFFSYWTKKEAVSKAIGKGLGISFSDILIRENIAQYKNRYWNLKDIIPNTNYRSCIAYRGERNIEKTELLITDLV